MNLCYEHRLNIQLKGIAHCLRTSLASIADSPWEYIDSSVLANSSSDDSDHLTRSEQCLTLKLSNGAWLKVAPLAPGGLICEDLLIQSDSRSFSPLQHFIKDSDFAPRPPCAMTSEQFHSRFRPDSQGHVLQSDRSPYRILIMMPDASECDHDDSLDKRIISLLGALISAPDKTSIECMHKDIFSATKSRELLVQLKDQIPGFSRLGMTALNPDRKTMLAAMMGNASLVLCGNSGSLADAFQLGLPAVLWNRASPLDTDVINHHVLKWFHQGCRTNKSMISSEQQGLWLNLHTGSRYAMTVANKSSQLHFTIENWLGHNNSGPTRKITLQGSRAARTGMEMPMTGLDLVLPSAFSPTANPSGLQQLRTSLGRKHRKFIKFRQSPTQFIQDSEVRWLRAFKHPR